MPGCSRRGDSGRHWLVFVFFALSLASLSVPAFRVGAEPAVRDGDIILHTSKSSQSKAIQLATGSEYSHIGVIFQENHEWFVYEAHGPVRSTPLREWIERGVGRHYKVLRLREPKTLSAEKIERLREAGLKFRGRPYDQYFSWSDDRIYCSELVWKIYKNALNLELGTPRALRCHKLSASVVKSKMKERYGRRIPFNEKTISPQDIYESKLLYVVGRG